MAQNRRFPVLPPHQETVCIEATATLPSSLATGGLAGAGHRLRIRGVELWVRHRLCIPPDDIVVQFSTIDLLIVRVRVRGRWFVAVVAQAPTAQQDRPLI